MQKCCVESKHHLPTGHIRLHESTNYLFTTKASPSNNLLHTICYAQHHYYIICLYGCNAGKTTPAAPSGVGYCHPMRVDACLLRESTRVLLRESTHVLLREPTEDKDMGLASEQLEPMPDSASRTRSTGRAPNECWSRTPDTRGLRHISPNSTPTG